jgi:hypothetical protein
VSSSHHITRVAKVGGEPEPVWSTQALGELVPASSPGLSRLPEREGTEQGNNRRGRDKSAFTRVFEALLPGDSAGESQVLQSDRNAF